MKNEQPKSTTLSDTPDDDDTPVIIKHGQKSIEFNLPEPTTPIVQKSQWVPPGQECIISSIRITCGMLYCGNSQQDPSGEYPTHLIHPNLFISPEGDLPETPLEGWPKSFTHLSRQHRRGYLEWLSKGRDNPNAPEGYVNLFFSGLERRICLDARHDRTALEDVTPIRQEINRLISTYNHVKALRSRLLAFRDYLIAIDSRAVEVARFNDGVDSDFTIRIKLSQAIDNESDIPVELALTWAHMVGTSTILASNPQLKPEFDKTFLFIYPRVEDRKDYFSNRDHLRVLPKIQYQYRGASPDLKNVVIDPILLRLPDYSKHEFSLYVLKSIIGKVDYRLRLLCNYFNKATNKTNNSSNQNPSPPIECYLNLPLSLWPHHMIDALCEIKAQIGEGVMLYTLLDLLSKINGQGPLAASRGRLIEFTEIVLTETLNEFGLGIEPDVLVDDDDDIRLNSKRGKVVLYCLPSDKSVESSPFCYEVAVLMVEKISEVLAHLPHELAKAKLAFLKKSIPSWGQLTDLHKMALLAKAELGWATKELYRLKNDEDEPFRFGRYLAEDDKKFFSQFLIDFLLCSQIMNEQELNLIEKFHAGVGLPMTKKAFAPIHQRLKEQAKNPKKAPVPFKLDSNRIAQLHGESESVSAHLANIFNQEQSLEGAQPRSQPQSTPCPTPEPSIKPLTLLGLDEVHCALAQTLLEQPCWPRAELQNIVSCLGLMLEGALLVINEACFEAYGTSLTEGFDPIVIEVEVASKIVQEPQQSP